MNELTFANQFLAEIGRLQSQTLPAIKEEKEICELCGRDLEESDWRYTFDDGAKWCGSCYEDEKCR